MERSNRLSRFFGFSSVFPRKTRERIGGSSRNLVYLPIEQFYTFPENWKSVPIMTFDLWPDFQGHVKRTLCCVPFQRLKLANLGIYAGDMDMDRCLEATYMVYTDIVTFLSFNPPHGHLSHWATFARPGGGRMTAPQRTRKLRKIATSGKRRWIGRGKLYNKYLNHFWSGQIWGHRGPKRVKFSQNRTIFAENRNYLNNYTR